MKKLKTLLGVQPLDNIVIRLISALIMSAILLMFPARLAFTEMARYSGVGLIAVAVCFAACFAALTFITGISRAKGKENSSLADKKALAALFLIYAFITVLIAKDYYYTLGICAAFAVLVWYYSSKGYILIRTFTKKKAIITVCAAAGIFAFVAGLYSVMRYYVLQTPNYDFGIFCQMFYNLRACLKPLTTVERDVLLSHFSVHMSLIYYLVLPVYAVFPSPVTIQLMQVFALTSAAAPVYLICRRYGLSDLKTALISVAVMLHPALIGGGSYDFHENCFLVPLLLWMFYFFEKEKYVPCVVFALLTCLVKEDAPIYILFFAAWAFAARKKKMFSVFLGAGALVYFVSVLAVMSKYGDGIMSGRYANFLCSPDDSLFSAIKNIIANPAYVFTQLFVDNDGDRSAKLLFLLQIMTPFAFLPFSIKKLSNLILLFPMVLINLMSLYVYQCDISYQYVYGPLAFVIYLAIINAAQTDDKKCEAALKTGAIAAALLFMTFYLPKAMTYVTYRIGNAEDIAVMTEYLDSIPEDASICASTMLIPRLSERAVLYEDYYHKPAEGEKLDYIICDGRYDKSEFIEKYQKLGYKITEEIKNSSGDVLLTVMR